MSATSTPRQPRARRVSTRGVVALTLPAAVLGGGQALAYWSETGTGTGTGATAAAAAVVTLAPATPTASMYPGGNGDVSVAAMNPGATEVVLPSLQLDTTQGTAGLTVDAGHSACPTTAFTFVPQDNGGAGWTVPGSSGGNAGHVVLNLPQALQLAASAPDACQGATVTVYLRAA